MSEITLEAIRRFKNDPVWRAVEEDLKERKEALRDGLCIETDIPKMYKLQGNLEEISTLITSLDIIEEELKNQEA